MRAEVKTSGKPAANTAVLSHAKVARIMTQRGMPMSSQRVRLPWYWRPWYWLKAKLLKRVTVPEK